MASRNLHRNVVLGSACAASFIALTFGASARADIPAGYKGTPFNPAVAGGPKLPPGTQGGPYSIPGRLDFVNYDMGGDGVAYHTGDHITKGGTGYRIDTPTATLSLTSVCIPNGGPPTCTNVWYMTSPTLDGTPYPSATTADFTIGAVQDGDWFNFTVNVETTGMYSLSSTWATGNGPPGGEGGDGSIGLSVFSNNVKLATWGPVIFPNFATTADFHHWMAYPNFAQVMLTAGPQVIKLQSGAKHLQLDYVQFSLMTADGGLDNGDGGGGSTTDASASSGSTSGSSSGSASGGSNGSGGTASGAAGGSGTLSTSGTISNSGSAAASGTMGTGGTTGATSSGASGPGGSGAETSGTSAPANGGGATSNASRKGCAVAAGGGARDLSLGLGLGAIAVAGVARRRRRPARATSRR